MAGRISLHILVENNVLAPPQTKIFFEIFSLRKTQQLLLLVCAATVGSCLKAAARSPARSEAWI
jgi:hypothetical protein